MTGNAIGVLSPQSLTHHFQKHDIHLPADWDLATLPNKSFVS
jgi:hypothetical protein